MSDYWKCVSQLPLGLSLCCLSSGAHLRKTLLDMTFLLHTAVSKQLKACKMVRLHVNLSVYLSVSLRIRRRLLRHFS